MRQPALSAAARPHSATALASWAKAILRTLEAAGLDAKPLLLQAGLDAEELNNPNARYPVEATTRLWQLAVAATGNPAFGLTVARHVSPTTFHALGYSLSASATLREAFEHLLRYFRIVTDAGELEFDLIGEEYRFALCIDPAGPQPADEAVDALMLVIVKFCRGLYGRSLSPLRVSFRRPAPADIGAYEQAFRAPLQFGARENTLIFPRDLFEQPLHSANPELVRHNDEVLVKYLALHDRSHIANRVHGALIDQLSKGEPTQEKIAETLHMSLRNLQRKLAAEQTSYKEILNKARHELALSYIEDPRHSISEIAYLLGFADLSSFTRAFKRWTGRSPQQYSNKPKG